MSEGVGLGFRPRDLVGPFPRAPRVTASPHLLGMITLYQSGHVERGSLVTSPHLPDVDFPSICVASHN